MTVNIEIPKKPIYLIFVFIVLVSLLVVVSAVWDTNKTVYHDAADVRIGISGINYALTDIFSGPSVTMPTTDLTLNPGGTNQRVIISNGDKLCLGGTAAANCKTTWPAAGGTLSCTIRSNTCTTWQTVGCTATASCGSGVATGGSCSHNYGESDGTNITATSYSCTCGPSSGSTGTCTAKAACCSIT